MLVVVVAYGRKLTQIYGGRTGKNVLAEESAFNQLFCAYKGQRTGHIFRLSKTLFQEPDYPVVLLPALNQH